MTETCSVGQASNNNPSEIHPLAPKFKAVLRRNTHRECDAPQSHFCTAHLFNVFVEFRSQKRSMRWNILQEPSDLRSHSKPIESLKFHQPEILAEILKMQKFLRGEEASQALMVWILCASAVFQVNTVICRYSFKSLNCTGFDFMNIRFKGDASNLLTEPFGQNLKYHQPFPPSPYNILNNLSVTKLSWKSIILFYDLININDKILLPDPKRNHREEMILSGMEDEDKWLAEGIAGIQHNAFYMHRALDANNLRDALKCSALMLSELRTSKLSPHKYYDLYMRAFDELRRLEIFFKDESRHGVSIVDLYELVQHAGNILPRLYLLCTVGSVYIKSKEAPAKDALKDLVEMCRGVQNPIRGLFLRSYLAQVSIDKSPSLGSEYEGGEDTVMDTVEFVLQNFTEMNKLCVRMQHQGPVRIREKLEKERNELRDLVGKNLHVLSQIEGVNLELYRDTVLPRVLEQIVNCEDERAQYYLMDCIIQVFPDEYHLQTLETLLGAFPQLQPTVDIKTVLSRLMERLSNYAASSLDVLPEFLQVEAFAKLSSAIGKVIKAQVDMPIVGAVTLYVSLLTFTLHVHPERLDYVDQVLGACVKLLLWQAKA
ncbi:hypothetical protein OIU78_021591 [Salix suchowensis]|nr:hypothetical protein OIU78_021591 [Salix suchowensis]